MPGTERQPSQPSSTSVSDGRKLGVDEHRKGHRIGLRISWVLVHAENDHPQADADLRRRKPGAIEIVHGVPHIAHQAFELGRAEGENRLRDREQARIAHLEDFAYWHGSLYLIDLFSVSLWPVYARSCLHKNIRLSDE